MNMKLQNHQFSTPQPTSDIYREWKHPWYEYNENGCVRRSDKAVLIKPNPPSKEAVERAKFVDKTYHWDGGSGSVRPRDQRTDT